MCVKQMAARRQIKIRPLRWDFATRREGRLRKHFLRVCWRIWDVYGVLEHELPPQPVG